MANGVVGVLGIPGIPNPFGSLASDIFGQFVTSMYHWVSDAVDQVGQNLVQYMNAQSTVNFGGGWWTSGHTDQLMHVVVRMSEYVMVICVLFAVVQGIMRGTPGLAAKAVMVDVPLSVLGIIVVATAVQGLASLTDWATGQVLSGVPGNIGHFLVTGGGAATAAQSPVGLTPLAFLLIFFIASVLVWIELAVRAAAVYLLVAMTPLALGARVWPAAAGIWRKLIEGIVALTLAKFVVGLAIGLGAAAVAGGGTTAPGLDLGGKAGTAVAGVMVGAALMLVAVFAPFVLLKLIPIGEAALVSSEVRRMGTSKATQTAMMGLSVSRLAGGHGGAGAAGRAMAGPGGAMVANAVTNGATPPGNASTPPPPRLTGANVAGGPAGSTPTSPTPTSPSPSSPSSRPSANGSAKPPPSSPAGP
jgi:hypothetical protein